MKQKRIRAFPVRMLLLCMVVIMSAVLLTVPMIARADEEEEENEFSLYTAAVAIGEYMSMQTKPAADGEVAGVDALSYGGSQISAGNAGAFCSYCDSSWLTGLLSNSSAKQSYKGLKDMPMNGSGSTTNRIWEYAQYGYLLNQLGLDTTNADGFSLCYPAGALMLLVYMAALFTDSIFAIVVSFLNTMNPFRLFGAAANASSLTGFSEKMDTVGDGGVFGSLANVVGKWYIAAESLSWQVVVPLMFASMIVTWILIRNMEAARTRLKKFIFLVAFLVIGIPACGSFYTTALDAMSDMTASGGGPATRVIASTFVDFEAWATNGRLAPPDGAVLSVTQKAGGDANEPSPSAQMAVRATCFAINQKFSYGAASLSGASPFATGSTSAMQVAQWNDTFSADSDSNDTSGSGPKSHTIDLLTRYMKKELFNSGDYEGIVSSTLRSYTSGTAEAKAVNKMFDLSDEKDDYKTDSGDEAAQRFFENGAFGSSNAVNIFSNGSLAYNTSSYTNGGQTVITNASSKSGLLKKTGLSAMSMYNYLNTRFESGNMICYSPDKASSGFIVKSHYSVSMVGDGLDRLLYYLNALFLIGAFMVIGMFYGLAMIFGNIRTSIKVITSVPFAMLGMVASIAKVLTYTLMLVIELLGTVFIYGIVTELLMDFNAALLMPIASKLAAIFPTVASGVISSILIITILLYGVFTILALRLRKSFIRTMNEMAGDIVDKFVGVKSGAANPGKPSLGQVAAGALANGAGAAVGAGIAGKIAKGPVASNPAGGTSTKPSSSSPNGSNGSSGGTGASGADGADGTQIDMNGNPVNVDENGNALPGTSDGFSENDSGTSTTTDGYGYIMSSDSKGVVTGSSDKEDKRIADSLGDSLGDSSSQTRPIQTDTSSQPVSSSDAVGVNDADGSVSGQDGQEQAMRSVKGNRDGQPDIQEQLHTNSKSSSSEDSSESKTTVRDVKGSVTAAKGAAEAAVGAHTGNAELAAKGARDAVSGVKEVKGSSESNSMREQSVRGVKSADGTKPKIGSSGSGSVGVSGKSVSGKDSSSRTKDVKAGNSPVSKSSSNSSSVTNAAARVSGVGSTSINQNTSHQRNADNSSSRVNVNKQSVTKGAKPAASNQAHNHSVHKKQNGQSDIHGVGAAKSVRTQNSQAQKAVRTANQQTRRNSSQTGYRGTVNADGPVRNRQDVMRNNSGIQQSSLGRKVERVVKEKKLTGNELSKDKFDI